jgi:membrane associated rhomboid family serine protease
MITLAILAITIGVSVLAFSDGNVRNKLIFIPYDVKRYGRYHTIVSHALLHADYGHLAVNMFVFYNFGNYLETFFVGSYGPIKGSFAFVAVYLGGIIAGAVPSMIKQTENPGYAAVGASAGVSAILFSFIFINPLLELQLILIPIPFKAFIFGFLYLLLETYLNKRGGTRVAHDAHIFGAIFGIILTAAVDINLFLDFFSQLNTYFKSFWS